jgi:hypothetical protein
MAITSSRRAAVSLFFVVFFLTALVVTFIGLSASSGFSFPSLSLAGADAQPGTAELWGEVRFTHGVVRIRADRSTDSAILGKLMPGDSVRADFAQAGWLAVFPVDAAIRDTKKALGYVYAPLLKERPPGGGSGATQ